MFKKKFVPPVPSSDLVLKTRMEDVVRKARNHDYKYIDPEAVKNIMGKWTPLSLWNFSYLMECFIASMNKTGASVMNAKGAYRSDIGGVPEALVGIGDRLLESNTKYRRGEWNLFDQLDFDILHQCVAGEAVETIVKPYFAFKEFQRPKEQTRVVLHATVARFEGTLWTISFPLQYIMKGYPKIKEQHFGYCHKIAVLNDDGHFDKEYAYIGVTSRNWLQRMSEHFNEIKSGSNKLFHRFWREFAGRQQVRLSSELIVGDHSFEQIMEWEEAMVDQCMDAGVSLNMIPGGFKGMKFLHKHRLLNSDRVSLQERERAIISFQKQHPRAGIANLLISELWKDADYAAKVICGAENRLSVEQVKNIRRLSADGTPINKICEIVGAQNVSQVKRVIDGKTYSRID